MSKKDFSQFTNKYSLSKTLRFELKPVGKTLEKMKTNFAYDQDLKTFLKDQKIEDAYQALKPFIDEIHKEFITSSLESERAKKIDFTSYFEAYKAKKDDKGEKVLREKIGELYKIGEENIKSAYQYGWKWNKKQKNLDKHHKLDWKVGGKEKHGAGIMVSPDILYAAATIAKKKGLEESDITKHLKVLEGFFTYFSGFKQNRANYYEVDEKATAIATRIVHENLPKFCDNVLSFEERKNEYLEAYNFLKRQGISTQIKDVEAEAISEDYFTISFFNTCLSQSQIEKYNKVIGCYNLLINLYNQAKKFEKKDSDKTKNSFKKLPQFKKLYKQIGCGEKKSLFDKLEYDKEEDVLEKDKKRQEAGEVLSVEELLKKANEAGEKYFSDKGKNSAEEVKTVPQFIDWLKENSGDWSGFYWTNKAVNTISNKYFASWYAIFGKIKDVSKKYDTVATYNEKREQQIKLRDAVELKGLFELLDQSVDTNIEQWWENFFKKSVWEEPKAKETQEEKKELEQWEKRMEKIKKAKSPSEALMQLFYLDINEHVQAFIDESENILALGEKYEKYKENEESKRKIKAWMEEARSVNAMLRYFLVREGKIKGDILNSELINIVKMLTDGESGEVNWFKWYDLLRNYLTQKPQDNTKENKLKLNFENSVLAGGWDVNEESKKSCVILYNPQDRKRYLVIMNKNNLNLFEESWEHGRGENCKIINNPLYEIRSEEHWNKMEYNFWSDVSKMIPKCSTQLRRVISHFKKNNNDFIFPVGYKVTSGEEFLEECKITKDQFELNNKVYKLEDNKIISKMRYDLDSNEEKKFVKGFQKKYWQILVKHANPEISAKDVGSRWEAFIKNGPQTIEDKIYAKNLEKWIDFCKYFLSKYPKTIIFDYDFQESSQYKSVDQFNRDVDLGSYTLKINKKVNKKVIDEYVKDGKIYLFEIKNQDSNNGKSNDHQNNLHTIYWDSVFKQLKNRPKLSGGAEIFYRRGLMDDEIVKKKDSKGKEVIENYRFSKEKFIFHVPVVLNFCLNNQNINSFVNNNVFVANNDLRFLGLDRGEKHLVYYALVDCNGNMIDQGSLNIDFKDKDGKPRSIKKTKQVYNENTKKWEPKEVDCKNYNDLLDVAAANRDEARKNWQVIGNIKNLKEGYISQVVHEIVTKVTQKPTFIVLEDLNTNFKRGRQKIDKSVYQKFELALAKKLNFVVDKKANPGEIGSVTRALQLTPPVQNYGDIENKKQVGIMLYTRANYTSQTDPITGWRKTIYLKSGSQEDIKKQIKDAFTDIGFDGNDYYFQYTDENTGKEWKLWSGKNGADLVRYRGKRTEDKNIWKTDRVAIKEKLDKIFDGFDKNQSLYAQIYDEGKEIARCDTDHSAWESLRFVIDVIQQIRNSGGENITVNNPDDDNFLLSPVRDENGNHFDSRKVDKNDKTKPHDADANGAFNIARKGVIMNAHIKRWIDEDRKMLKSSKGNKKKPDLDLFVSDKEWDLWLNKREQWEKELSYFASRSAKTNDKKQSKK